MLVLETAEALPDPLGLVQLLGARRRLAAHRRRCSRRPRRPFPEVEGKLQHLDRVAVLVVGV